MRCARFYAEIRGTTRRSSGSVRFAKPWTSMVGPRPVTPPGDTLAGQFVDPSGIVYTWSLSR